MAKWEASSSRQIDRRFVITGTLVLDTPASFSNGETSGTELVILEDTFERRPLIPGASLAGALRHYLLSREIGFRQTDTMSKEQKTITTFLFGEALDENTEDSESRVIVNDALGQGTLGRRAGVRINDGTRTADDGMLFSTQVWGAGTRFDLRFELILFKDDPDDFISAVAATLLALGNGEIPMGGRKHRGYGRAHVEEWRVCYYDLGSPVALTAWLLDDLLSDEAQGFFDLGTYFEDHRQFIRVEATMRLCDSILIRDISDVADNEQLTSNGHPVLSGTSLAGTLRSRALKIANTIHPKNGVNLVDDLFGKHGKEGESDSLTASRLIVEENAIQGRRFNHIQNRVKIDRFTGGAFETALFEERPLFADDETFVQLNLELRYPANTNIHAQLDAQTGLLLLLLKDLWTEDLPLGGESSIGRGRLHGLGARVYFKFADDPNPVLVEFNEYGLISSDDGRNLQSYIDALWSWRGGKNVN